MTAMTSSDDSREEQENDEGSDDSIVRSLKMTKRLLKVAVLVARLLRML